VTPSDTIDALRLHKVCAQMIDAMTDAVILVDTKGMITRMNRATQWALGYTEKEILNAPLHKILKASNQQEQGSPPPEKDLLQEVISNIEGFMFPKEGEAIPISLRSSFVKEDDGEVSGIVLVARDLRRTKELLAKAAMAEAERRKFEELKRAYDELTQLQEQLIQSEKMASLGQIAAGVAHEINNPISGIMVYLHTLAKDLEEDQLDKEQGLKYLTDSQHELKRCSRIIKSLLDFSRQSHPKLASLDLADILKEVFSILGYKAKLQDIELVQYIEPGVYCIEADADQLQQVFLNLILNAIQAMPEGGRLTIRASVVDETRAKAPGSKTVRVDIEDTGCGIDTDNLDKVFTPFFTTKEKGEGVGLGLAVAYGIVRRHGGDIKVRSSTGQGTVFSVFLAQKDV
jgi:PAS domain S-box-containing protein